MFSVIQHVRHLVGRARTRVALATLAGALPLAVAGVAPAHAATYAVQPGDTLWHIALSTGSSIQALAQLNNLGSGDSIFPGQLLQLTDAPADSLSAWKTPKADGGVLIETGIASTYGTGDGFQGNLTACGQVFDTFVVQVAHKTLPCGTLLRIEDAHTGTSVLAEVTDRGPYIAGRVVDLSWAAYQVLDPIAPGLRQVNVYRLT